MRKRHGVNLTSHESASLPVYLSGYPVSESPSNGNKGT